MPDTKMLFANQIAGFWYLKIISQKGSGSSRWFLDLDNIKDFFKLIHCFCWAWPAMPKVPKITSLQYLSNISRKRPGINLIFCMKIKIKVFYKLISPFLVAIARHAQNTQNNNFGKSLQYFKKEWSDEDDFCMHVNITLF